GGGACGLRRCPSDSRRVGVARPLEGVWPFGRGCSNSSSSPTLFSAGSVLVRRKNFTCPGYFHLLAVVVSAGVQMCHHGGSAWNKQGFRLVVRDRNRRYTAEPRESDDHRGANRNRSSHPRRNLERVRRQQGEDPARAGGARRYAPSYCRAAGWVCRSPVPTVL